MTETQDPEKLAQDTCSTLLDGMTTLRDFPWPSTGVPAPVVHSSLVDLRGRLDLAEELVQNAVVFRSQAKSRAAELKEQADDAWDNEISSISEQAVQRDFEGAQARYAKARLSTLPALRRSRTAQRVAELAASTEEQVKTSYRGLKDIREELLARLRYLEWEKALER